MRTTVDNRRTRVGMLGLDTSHVVAFAKLVNAPDVSGALARIRITAAFPAGNPAFPLSRDRIAGVTVFGSRGIVHHNQYYDYVPLLEAIAEFFRTGVPPVPADETVELFAFLEAAEASKRRGGVPVALSEVMAEAQAEATRILA